MHEFFSFRKCTFEIKLQQQFDLRANVFSSDKIDVAAVIRLDEDTEVKQPHFHKEKKMLLQFLTALL